VGSSPMSGSEVQTIANKRVAALSTTFATLFLFISEPSIQKSKQPKRNSLSNLKWSFPFF